MIQRIPADERHYEDFGWLKTYWLFSFDTYRDPANMAWGLLRVFNDDLVEQGKGFGTHPHRDMEIVTIVHTGELTHEDSSGGKGVIRAGEVQRMSAGSGIFHSEYNHGKDPVSLYQIWLLPKQRNLEPDYEQMLIGDVPPNSLKPLAAGDGVTGALKMNTDATIYLGNVQEGGSLLYQTGRERRVFLYISEGNLKLDTVSFLKGDQARVKEEETLTLDGVVNTNFVLIDTAQR